MRKLFLIALSSAAVLAAPAMAADMKVKAPILAPPPAFSWTGCHIGGNIGGKSATTSGSVDVAAATGPAGATPASSFHLTDTTSGSFIGGGQLGCDYQGGWWVIGAEGDADWQSWSQSRTVGLAPPALFVTGDTFDVSSKWQASLRGRAGIAMDRVLLYATGGVAWTNVTVGTNFIVSGVFPSTVVSDSKTITGVTGGAGFDYAMTNNVIFGLEGRYTVYDSQTFNSGLLATSTLRGLFTFAPATTTLKLNTAEVLAKINFKFF